LSLLNVYIDTTDQIKSFITENQTLQEKFAKLEETTQKDIEDLKNELKDVREEAKNEINDLREEAKLAKEELNRLKTRVKALEDFLKTSQLDVDKLNVAMLQKLGEQEEQVKQEEGEDDARPIEEEQPSPVANKRKGTTRSATRNETPRRKLKTISCIR
jgi:hypothetical protein